MKAALEGPLLPVFCLHGLLQKLVWRGVFANLDLEVNVTG